jgi:hypothetical protein
LGDRIIERGRNQPFRTMPTHDFAGGAYEVERNAKRRNGGGMDASRAQDAMRRATEVFVGSIGRRRCHTLVRQANDSVSRATGCARSLRGAHHTQQESLKHQRIDGDERKRRLPSAGSTSQGFVMRAHRVMTLNRANTGFKPIVWCTLKERRHFRPRHARKLPLRRFSAGAPIAVNRPPAQRRIRSGQCRPFRTGAYPWRSGRWRTAPASPDP